MTTLGDLSLAAPGETVGTVKKRGLEKRLFGKKATLSKKSVRPSTVAPLRHRAPPVDGRAKLP
jgi:hypothetical protein